MDEKRYYSIGGICQIAQVKSHVLRYWEDEGLLRPIRTARGQRRYSQRDLERVVEIKDLLYVKKYRVAGVRKYLHGHDRQVPQPLLGLQQDVSPQIQAVTEIKKDLQDVLRMLR